MPAERAEAEVDAADDSADDDPADDPDDATDVPGGRHTESPGRITRSSDALFVDSNVDIDTPARVAIPHQLSPDTTV